MTDPDDQGDAQIPCGLYKTTRPVEDKVPAGTLVYYHNHGDPGPGLYPPQRWSHNKAIFSKRGILLPEEGFARSLEPLPEEGFYRVSAPFYCCEKRCQLFETDALVQLGYDGKGDPIIFQPRWTAEGLDLPERGRRVELERLDRIEQLKVASDFGESRPPNEEDDGPPLH